LNEPEIIFRDQRFVVLNKPAGLAVHPGPSGGPSVEDWFPLLSRRPDGPWLAHRLDADTAGCLLIALRKQPLLAAQALFAAGAVEKVYWAVVNGEIRESAGIVDAPLRRLSEPTGWRMTTGSGGLVAVSAWRVLGRGAGCTWLEVRPRTGRTHQVRLHCRALGTPVIGDERYGGGPGGLHLLARALRVPLDPPVDVVAPPPAHMLVSLRSCGYRG
jgi:tRNA pseudouridine32 synthase/23S rRNA pseudouridine746 synthase